MLYEFRQSVHLKGTDFHKGVHEVPEEVEYDARFMKFVSIGLVVEAQEQMPAISVQSDAQRNKLLHDKLIARAAEARAKRSAKAKAPEAAAPVPTGVEKAEAKAEAEAQMEAGAEKVAEAQAESVQPALEEKSESVKPAGDKPKRNKKG